MKVRPPPAQVEYMTPGPIRVYQVTEDKLNEISLMSGDVTQDLAFMTCSLGVFASFVIAIVSTSPSSTTMSLFQTVAIVSFVIFSYTGFRWYRRRDFVKQAIQQIKEAAAKGITS